MTHHHYSTQISPDSIIIMNKVFGILLFGLTAVVFNSNSIASNFVEKAVQKRIEMFKASKANIKKLRTLIRSGDTSKAVPLADFHVAWSKEMPMLFPLGSEASTLNGSDASSDIWDNPIGFRNAVDQYNLKSKELLKSLVSPDLISINETFKNFSDTCKGCHKQFRN